MVDPVRDGEFLPKSIKSGPMSRSEAENATSQIRGQLGNIRSLLIEMQDREGWRALNYRNWRDYISNEFVESERQIYRQVTAGRIEYTICPTGQIGTIPERHLRPLAELKSADEWRTAWRRANSIANGSGLTEAIVARAVQEILEDRKRGDLIMLNEVARPKAQGTAKLNRTNDNVHWAWWTWNPVTGCLHDCPYCYARDIANRFYPQKFEPTFHEDRLCAPRNTPIPDVEEPASRRVFTCSMADLFGRWVPQKWIDAVFEEITANPGWEFLCLTKFPQRLAELEWPANAWVGTSVDRQSRVSTAQRAFRDVKAGVRWLSCEPMLEPLKFKDLSMFDWVVIGGASPSTQTKSFSPPLEWMLDLWKQAKDAGCKVWFKPNSLSQETPLLMEIPDR